MTHSTNKNSFKNQGLAILTAWTASFGKRFAKKKLFKINDLPFMTQIVRLKWHGVDSSKQARKERVKRDVTEM